MSDINSLRVLMPLPSNLWHSNCAKCDKPQARWTIRGVKPDVFVCSLCLLYKTGWGQRNESLIETTLESVEKSRDQPFVRQDSRLFNCPDADSVMGVIVLVERTLSRVPRG